MAKANPQAIACQECHVHVDMLQKVQQLMPDEKKLLALAEIFKVFGDGTRIRIMCALMQGEMCVCDISALLDISQSAVSHQLRLLKAQRLVKNRRDGKRVLYSLDDEHVLSILLQGLHHIEEA